MEKSKKSLTISLEMYEKFKFFRLFRSYVKENDAIIKIIFTDKYGNEAIMYRADYHKIYDPTHLANFIKKVIRDKFDKHDITCTAFCDYNPWNVTIKANYDSAVITMKLTDDDIRQIY